MDDLSGLDWSSSNDNSYKPAAQAAKPPFAYPSIQPTPSPSISGRSTPLTFNNSQQNTGIQGKVLRPGSSRPTTTVNDSFANLLKPSASKAQNTLSLQERQRQLQEEKARQEEERRKNLEAQYGSQSAFWDELGGERRATTASPPTNARLSHTINKPFEGIPLASQTSNRKDDEEDLLAAFNSSAPVDASSHFPPPQTMNSGWGTPGDSKSRSPPPLQSSNNSGFDFVDDDDPFGLNEVKQKSNTSAPPPPTTNDDDDILGMLGKPVSELPKPKTEPAPETKSLSPSPPAQDSDMSSHPQAKAVSELVDMGFPAGKAANALAQTDTGTNVQAAVSILLNQAHEEARLKARGRQETSDRPGGEGERSRRPQREGRIDSSMPSWTREEPERERSGSRPGLGNGSSGDKDFAKQAQAIGTSLFKSANSLWKQGQRQVQKAMAEFQQDADPSQPRWMREAHLQEAATQRRSTPEQRPTNGKAPIEQSLTNEAMLLESRGPPPKPPRSAPRSAEISRASTPASASSGQWNDIPDDMLSAPRSRGTSRQPTPNRSAQRLTRQDVEEYAGQVVVSSRRRRPTPQPATATPPPSNASPAPLASPPTQSPNPFNTSKPATPATSKPPTPLPSRPKAPPRTIPPVSSLALQNSSKQRASGGEAFKRGDYAAAHEHYTSALQGIPHTHPIAIVIFCNRALTSIKNGDPRGAVSDADSALNTIGVSRGEGEKIALGGDEGEKDMKEFYGKALTRKAEALEHMEKWSEAAKVWREAVSAGIGGAVSIQGRNRCEKAAGGASANSARSTPTPQSATRKPPPARKPASTLSALQGSEEVSSEAVQRMRAANAAAEQADDEKFALTDKVDAMLLAWKGTKADNLRALLGSLDKVLWPEAGWNKVGMQDLVMPNRVKIVYMKAIAKVHPDKIPTTATTEQKMISAAVFATLNEAWDKFKKDNGL
ncbi:uncharacterized protein PV09_02089 [Verruconis gallopava]|uniref:UBA domain-containing protein n=1 Tax=Verruconis gallopava TaxID=253628 RepID=A0A0D1Z2P4_9PEZI|nr:uncharacterized protein PV09_02089 [Verruconis gallopava]KIW07232.1 hypothetical protein PV09_02089 [Verruconis gallopava]